MLGPVLGYLYDFCPHNIQVVIGLFDTQRNRGSEGLYNLSWSTQSVN